MGKKHKVHLWWGPPINFSERKYERKISWLELFYDLVYVATIGQLTHQIAAAPTWHTLGYSCILFSLVFWSWVNGSEYYDLHGNEGLRTRFITFWQMLAIAAVAITIPEAFNGNHRSFAIAFMVIEGLIMYMWWSVSFYDPSHKAFSVFYTVNYSIAFGFLLISVFTNHHIATILWIAALLFNLAPPFVAARRVIRIMKERGTVFTASAAIVERFGLFTIIVLAESILSTVSGMGEVQNKQPAAWVAFILAIMIAFLIWSLYFDMTSEQETKKGYSYMQWLMILHFPLLASLSIVGACIRVILADMNTTLPMELQWIFCLSLTTILYSIIGLTKIMKEEEEDRSYIQPVTRLLVGAGIFILLIPVFGTYLNTLKFLTIVAIILAVPVIIGIRSWVRYKFSK